MKFQVTLGGEQRSVELRRAGDAWECAVDGLPRAVDVVEAAPGVFSLLVEGQSFAVHVEAVGDGYRVHTRGTDFVAGVANPRRWAGRSGGGAGRAGRQDVTAPMPGKVIRVLVEENQEVEAGQGLVVVEAMKMQNEIPSPKKGVVEKVLVGEGETVEHGQPLVVVA
ncbi:MAG: biotin/lipoyl-binding protein [Acidobacteria bacterium]|nr:biotin/lipoyl-binding protein [Acidobacteriota bacterium]